MKPSINVALVAVALVALGGCSSGDSLFGANLVPTGDIVLSNPQTGATFTTSSTHPLDVDGNSFSIGIHETHFGGPYSIQSYSYDTGFNEPCYVPHIIDQTDATNVVQFRPDNASPITNGRVAPNPCNPAPNDLEVWLINDGKGHQLFFYTYLPSNPVPAAALRRG